MFQNFDYTAALPKKRDKYDGMMIDNKENVIQDEEDARYDAGIALGDPETASLKIVTLCHAGCGASSFMIKMIYNDFSEETYENKLLQWDQHQTQYKFKYQLDDKDQTQISENIRISVFDLKGFDDVVSKKEMDDRIGEGMNHSNVVLLMYSIDNIQSFKGDFSIQDIKQYMDKHINKLNNKKIVLLIATKSDLDNERQIQKSDGQNLADQWQIPFIEISNKTGANIKNVIEEICRIHKKNKDGVNYPPPVSGGCCVIL